MTSALDSALGGEFIVGFMSDLVRDGFVLLQGALDPVALETLRGQFEAAVPERKSGTRHISVWPDEKAVIRACTPPAVLAAVQHILQRPHRMVRIHGRDPLAGGGRQGLHVDWVHGGPVAFVATALAYLDDFDRENGATRLVPGTHRFPFVPDRRSGDPAFVHNEEVTVKGRAGTVLLFNGHLWHSGTCNRSGRPRRALQYTFQVD